MPIPHPFANVQLFRKSFSSPNQNVNWSPDQLLPVDSRGEDEEEIEVPPLPKHIRSQSVTRATRAIPGRPQTALVASRPTVPAIDVNFKDNRLGSSKELAPWSARASPGHYVKHSSKATVLLNGQNDFSSSAGPPVYTNGATIEGIVAIPRPSGLLTLEVKVSLSPVCIVARLHVIIGSDLRSY